MVFFGKFLICSPKLGEMIPFDLRVFFNNHPTKIPPQKSPTTIPKNISSPFNRWNDCHSSPTFLKKMHFFFKRGSIFSHHVAAFTGFPSLVASFLPGAFGLDVAQRKGFAREDARFPCEKKKTGWGGAEFQG